MGTESSFARSHLFDDASWQLDERAAIVLDALPFDVIHVDRTARIRYVNRAAMRTLERIQAFLPVASNQVLGQPIDILERLPEVVDLTMSPMLDECGKYVGTVLTTRCHDAQNHASLNTEKLQEHAVRVVAAVEKLQTSASAMMRSTSAAAKAGQDGVEVSEETQRIVERLRESSVQIGHLVSLVASIARQTSLLTLTAGIEAARSGGDSSPFGVLANDIKVLAKQTAKASDEIRNRAAAIHDNSGAASAALLRIDGIMRELNAYQDEISSAVQSQSRVAGGIAREVMEVARCTSEIAEGASWVPQARGAAEGASDIRTTYFGRSARPKA